MRYKSKKDETIYANFVNEMADGGVMLVYETGPHAGDPLTISDSTLKRWWTPVDSETTEESVDEFLESINSDVINEPYRPNVTPHVMEVPESVVKYENIKKRKNKFEQLPEFSDICDALESKLITKINENSKYIKFVDGTTLWKKVRAVNVYATEKFAEKLIEAGLTSEVNKDKDRPFGFKIDTMDKYNTLVSTILEMEENK